MRDPGEGSDHQRRRTSIWSILGIPSDRIRRRRFSTSQGRLLLSFWLLGIAAVISGFLLHRAAWRDGAATPTREKPVYIEDKGKRLYVTRLHKRAFLAAVVGFVSSIVGFAMLHTYFTYRNRKAGEGALTVLDGGDGSGDGYRLQTRPNRPTDDDPASDAPTPEDGE